MNSHAQKILAALLLALLCTTPASAVQKPVKHPAAKGMTPKEKAAAEARAKWVVDAGKKLLFAGKPPTTFGGSIKIAGGLNIVEGNLPDGTAFAISEDTYGVEISEGVVRMPTGQSRDFVIAHEYGHLFSEKVAEGMKLPGVGGKATEVIADLISAYLLIETWNAGGPPTKRKLLEDTLIAGLERDKAKVFGGESGDHPSGEKRIEYIKTLFKKLDAKHSLASFLSEGAAILKAL